MKYCIIIIKDKKPVGYWWNDKNSQYGSMEIRTKTIQTFTPDEIEKEFKLASGVIVKKYGEDHVPAITIVSTQTDADSFRQSIAKHLEYVKLSWSLNNPELVKLVEDAVNKINI